LHLTLSVALITLLSAARMFAAPAPEAMAAPALTVEQIVAEVLSNNPSLKAARADWEAATERIPQARAWDDPRAGVDATAGRFVDVPANSFTDNKYFVEQAIPLSGKNRLRGKAATADAAVALAELRRRELDLTASARMAFYRLAGACEQLSLNRRNAALLQQFVEISRNKYEVGTKSESDVLTAETELGKQEETRFDFERQISDAQSQLNVLMNRPARAPLGTPAPLVFAPLELLEDNIQSMALSHRPELLVAQRRIDAAKSRLTIAKRDWIPEPSLSVEASQYNQSSQAISEVVAGISFNLPWFHRSKYSAAVRENKKMLESAEQDLEALQMQTLGLVRDHLKKIETLHHHAELFRSKLIPLAEQNITATRLGYENNKTGFLNLLEAQRTLQAVQSEYENHLTDYLSARAELEAMMGVDPSAQPADHKKGHHE
jgi:outer membrane protein, heavy metal efflux system